MERTLFTRDSIFFAQEVLYDKPPYEGQWFVCPKYRCMKMHSHHLIAQRNLLLRSLFQKPAVVKFKSCTTKRVIFVNNKAEAKDMSLLEYVNQADDGFVCTTLKAKKVNEKAHILLPKQMNCDTDDNGKKGKMTPHDRCTRNPKCTRRHRHPGHCKVEKNVSLSSRMKRKKKGIDKKKMQNNCVVRKNPERAKRTRRF